MPKYQHVVIKDEDYTLLSILSVACKKARAELVREFIQVFYKSLQPHIRKDLLKENGMLTYGYQIRVTVEPNLKEEKQNE